MLISGTQLSGPRYAVGDHQNLLLGVNVIHLHKSWCLRSGAIPEAGSGCAAQPPHIELFIKGNMTEQLKHCGWFWSLISNSQAINTEKWPERTSIARRSTSDVMFCSFLHFMHVGLASLWKLSTQPSHTPINYVINEWDRNKKRRTEAFCTLRPVASNFILIN